MSLRVKCPQCQATCVVAESAAGRKVRCPRCQNLFLSEGPSVAVEAITDAEPAAPPPRTRGGDLIPPPRKRPDNELIPPPPGGVSVKKTPGFMEREARDLVFLLIVGGVVSVVMIGIIAVVAGWWAFK